MHNNEEYAAYSCSQKSKPLLVLVSCPYPYVSCDLDCLIKKIKGTLFSQLWCKWFRFGVNGSTLV